MELKPGAEIATNFDAALRHVTLVRGEAHFAVAKDAGPTFVVRAGGVEVRAVGTAFTVQLAPAAVEVVVTEGLVKVTPHTVAATHTAGTASTVEEPERSASRASADPIGGANLIDAGQRLEGSMRRASRIKTVSADAIDAQLAWRMPQLEFSRTPLHDVGAALNDHARRAGRMTFEIADADLRDVRLTGLLRADNAAGLERLIEVTFNVRAEGADGKFILRRLAP